MLLEFLCEVGPFDVLRNDVAGAVLCTSDVMNRNDSRMIKIGDRPGFGKICLGIFRL
jgi:hypothetical protein